MTLAKSNFMKAALFKRLTPLLLVLLLVSCGGKPQIKALSANSTVLAFGDSLTAGTGAQFSRSYPAMLQKALGCEVLNAGKPGEKTKAGLRRLKTRLKTDRPDLVILCHGGNDFLGKLAESETRANVDQMVSACKISGADVILIGVPKPGIILKSAAFYEELAKQHNIPYDAKIIPKTLQTPGMKSDQIHPNEKGYAQIAETIAKLIKSSSN